MPISTYPIDFLYPREGTETHARRRPQMRLLSIFLSPRGDGNRMIVLSHSTHVDFLYPREGTETAMTAARAQTRNDFLYPREGTETTACLGKSNRN